MKKHLVAIATALALALTFAAYGGESGEGGDKKAAPNITSQPQDRTVNAGLTTVFTASASGIPAPTYQWQLNSGSGWNNIGNATASERILYAASKAQREIYQAFRVPLPS
jgi:endoglucanase